MVEIEDGYGGVSEELTPLNFVLCKVSVSNDTQKATAYGVLAEQVLEVVSAIDINLVDLYEFKNKKYSVRRAFRKGRYFYSTLVEVK